MIMQNFKAGDKVAIITNEGGFVFKNKDSMDFDFSEYEAFDKDDFTAIHLKDVDQINRLPPSERFEAAKKLYQS